MIFKVHHILYQVLNVLLVVVPMIIVNYWQHTGVWSVTSIGMIYVVFWAAYLLFVIYPEFWVKGLGWPCYKYNSAISGIILFIVTALKMLSVDMYLNYVLVSMSNILFDSVSLENFYEYSGYQDVKWHVTIVYMTREYIWAAFVVSGAGIGASLLANYRTEVFGTNNVTIELDVDYKLEEMNARLYSQKWVLSAILILLVVIFFMLLARA